MERRPWIRFAAAALFFGLLASCQRAERYDPRKPRAPAKEANQQDSKKLPLEEDIVWMKDLQDDRVVQTPIRFVHEGTAPAEWAQLKYFWNDTTAAQAAGIIGLPGFGGLIGVPAAGKIQPVIVIRVPLGLDDPTPFIPSNNPLTLAKWELGRELFFDETWLNAKEKQSCASCHNPTMGYTDGKREVRGSFNTPTLMNVVFNRYQFWDGRATYLEEVVQRTLEDERESDDSDGFHHVWNGVVGRLRRSSAWANRFADVYGNGPTQDRIGRALATYMRTILAGNSLYDRAEQFRRKKCAQALEEAHFAAVLNDRDLRQLERAKAAKEVVSGDLGRGTELFNGKALCSKCHSPDKGPLMQPFHNIGVGLADYTGRNRAKHTGRFVVAPLGEKTRDLNGAFKTPTLRSLLRTGPYFHNGQAETLEEVVRFHLAARPGAPENPFLDPVLARPDGFHKNLGLSKGEIEALVLFLRALNGDDVDDAVRAPPPTKKADPD
jgi:cytochrome c peroxidase